MITDALIRIDLFKLIVATAGAALSLVQLMQHANLKVVTLKLKVGNFLKSMQFFTVDIELFF